MYLTGGEDSTTTFPESPDGFARVSFFCDWIRNAVCAEIPNEPVFCQATSGSKASKSGSKASKSGSKASKYGSKDSESYEKITGNLAGMLGMSVANSMSF